MGGGKLHENPGGGDSSGLCVPSCGGGVWDGSGSCAVRQLWGAETGLVQCCQGGVRAGSGNQGPSRLITHSPHSPQLRSTGQPGSVPAQGLPGWPEGSPSPPWVLSPRT